MKREKESGGKEMVQREKRFLEVGVWHDNKRRSWLMTPLLHEKLLGFHVQKLRGKYI